MGASIFETNSVEESCNKPETEITDKDCFLQQSLSFMCTYPTLSNCFVILTQHAININLLTRSWILAPAFLTFMY